MKAENSCGTQMVVILWLAIPTESKMVVNDHWSSIGWQIKQTARVWLYGDIKGMVIWRLTIWAKTKSAVICRHNWWFTGWLKAKVWSSAGALLTRKAKYGNLRMTIHNDSKKVVIYRPSKSSLLWVDWPSQVLSAPGGPSVKQSSDRQEGPNSKIPGHQDLRLLGHQTPDY